MWLKKRIRFQCRYTAEKKTENMNIDDYAYFGRTDIETIILPDSIESIGSGAFSGCRALVSIHIPEGVERIGDGAFFGCSSLREIIIPKSVKHIGEHAFSSCSLLEKITLPAELKDMGKGLFQGCDALKEITVEGEGLLSSEDGVLFCKGTEGRTLFVFPQGKEGDYRIPAGTARISEGAFRGCSRLDKVIVSEDVSFIGDRAFAGCTDIFIEIENPGIEFGMLPFDETANVSFADNKKKRSPYAAFGEVDFEEKLSKIKYIMPVHKKFVVPKEKWSTAEKDGSLVITSYNGDDLEITTPARINDTAVTEIGDYAFSPEKGGIDRKRREVLAGIRSIFLARDIKKLGTGVFKNCTSLEYVLVPNSVDSIGDRAFSGCSSLSAVTLPMKTDYISKGLFFGCKRIENIDIPEGIASIGELAFSGCERITYITIPEGVKEIGRKAFAGCRYLMYINFPESLEHVGADAFRNTLWYSSRPDGVIYAGKCVVGYKGESPDITIGEGIVSISDGAFSGNERAESIHIPDSVRHIGSEAFWNCSKLREITLPKGLKSLGERVFSGCRMLKSMNIPEGVTAIGEFAFSGCINMHSVNIPSTVRIIEREAFRACGTLHTVKIPEGVTCIGDEAFNNCTSLTDVYLPDSLEDIDERAFVDCPNLIIRGRKGSRAEQIALKAKLRFQECSDI